MVVKYTINILKYVFFTLVILTFSFPASSELSVEEIIKGRKALFSKNYSTAQRVQTLSEKGDLDDALDIIMNSSAIERSRKLAEDFAMLSKEAIVWLPDSDYKRALLALPEFVLSRIY